MAPTSTQPTGRHMRLYRALLILFPRSFRADYGDAMAQLFGDRLRDVGGRAWLNALPDLVRSVPTERGDALMARLESPGSRVLAMAIAVVGAVVVVLGVGGGGVALVVAIAVIGVVITQRRVFMGVSRGDWAPLRHAATQSWWAPIAALLGLATIVFGVGTVFEANNMGGRIVGSSLLLAMGAAMFVGLKRRPFDRIGGNAMILVATVPALLFFWIVVPTILALLVWIGVLASGFDDVSAPVAAPLE